MSKKRVNPYIKHLKTRNNPIKPKTTETISVKREALSPFKSVQLVKIVTKESSIYKWRHRYTIGPNSNKHFQRVEDYEKSQFKNLKEFKEFITNQPPIPDEITLKYNASAGKSIKTTPYEPDN